METTQEIQQDSKAQARTDDFLPLKRIHHVEFYVGDAKQSSFFYQYAMGFKLKAYSGLETKDKLNSSYMLEQGKIKFVLTSANTDASPAAEHHLKHGDGVKDIAFEVDDAVSAYEETVKRGAVGVLEPTKFEDENGYIIKSSIQTYGETTHTFLDINNYNGEFLPGFINAESKGVQDIKDVNLRSIDHMVGNVELGKMNFWVKFYAEVMGFITLI